MSELKSAEGLYAYIAEHAEKCMHPSNGAIVSHCNALIELKQWGDEREAAGRREIEEAACLRGQHVARRPGGCACGHMPPMALGLDDAPAPEPGAEPFKPVWRDPPLTPKPEQRETLAERMMDRWPDLNPPLATHEQAAIHELAEAVDALTADRKTVFDELNRLGIKVAALEPAVDNLETKTAHLPFPAAPEPGA